MNRWLWVILLFLGMAFCQLPASTVNGQGLTLNVSFRDEVAPILAAKCLHCHGPERSEADFRVDVADNLADYVEAGDPESSELLSMLRSTEEDYRMPPALGDHLSDGDLSIVEGWIVHGAKHEEVKDWKEKRFEGSDLAKVDTVGGALWALLGRFHPALVHFPIALFTVAAFFAVFSFGNLSMEKAAIYCLVLGSLGSIAAAAAGWGFAEYQGWPDYRMDLDVSESVGASSSQEDGDEPADLQQDADSEPVDSPSAAIESQESGRKNLSEAEREALGGKVVDPGASLMDLSSFTFFKGTDRSMHRWGGVAVCLLSLVVTALAMYVRRNPDNSQFIWKLSTVVLAGMVGWVGHQGGEIHYGNDLYEQPLKRLQQILDENKAKAADVPVVDQVEADDADSESSSDKQEEQAEDVDPEVADVTAESVTADEEASADEASADEAGEDEASTEETGEAGEDGSDEGEADDAGDQQ